MPYIITTINTCDCCDERKPGLPGAGGAAHLCGDCSDSDGRTAVATLDEARDHVTDMVPFPRYGHRDTERVGSDLSAMRESGGTIGPLADGTVIEVRPRSWPDLQADGGLSHRMPLSDANILSVFNTGAYVGGLKA